MNSAGGETMESDAWTVLRLLEWTTDFLSKHGSASPRLDAEVLLGAALECSRIDLYTRYAEVASEEQRGRFRALVKRRSEGAPVAYLVGEREFYSRGFFVDERVLIPRPETEFIVLELLDGDRAAAPIVVDAGTGSGVLAVTAALEIPEAQVFALDLSTDALEVARANAERHGVSDRIVFLQSDLLAALPPDVTPDVVVSNPPYVSEAEWQSLDPTVRDFEPRTALVAGPQGTEIIARLVQQAGVRLRVGGRLIIELSPMIADASLALVNQVESFEAPRLRNDLSKRPRVLSARRC